MECIDAFCHIFPSRFFEMMIGAMATQVRSPSAGKPRLQSMISMRASG